MNRLIQTLSLLVAAGLLSSTGCHRRAPEPPTVDFEDSAQTGGVNSTAEDASPALAQAGPEESTNSFTQLARHLFLAATPAEGEAQPEEQEASESASSPDSTDDSVSSLSKRQLADELFQKPTLLRIQIEIPPSGINVLRQTRWEGGRRPETRITVREGGHVYTNVTVHLKGAAGSFRPIQDKPALTLNFDKAAPGQSFHGLHKISLNNSVQDGSYLCEKIARELFIAAGVPTPRAAHATVELNGRYLGLYVLLEGANKQFLKRYFDNAKGNLYDGGFCRDIDSRLRLNCGEDPKNQAGLNALRAAVRSPSYAKLEKALDVDRFLSMVALEVMLAHWDGYSQNKNNWRIYHDLDANRMVFIPHGLDQLFGGGRGFDPDDPIMPHGIQGQVTSAVLGTREGQRRYRELAARIYADVFKVDAISDRIDEIATGVSKELAETDPAAARAFQRRAASLKQRVIRRAAGLRQQLGGPPPRTVEFGAGGVLALNDWKEGLAQSGEPILRETKDPDGQSVLVINAGQGASSGSWRTQLTLAGGNYRFEGRVRVLGVTVAAGDQRSGAGLRISKGTMPRKLSGTSGWQAFQYPFEIREPVTEVELVCELKATAGEAWFDANSLRLVRVK